MKAYQIGTLIVLTGAIVFAFQNCANRGQSSLRATGSAADMEKSMKTLEADIKTLNARDLSCDTAADCTVVPVGAAHCGTPTFFLVGSKRSGDHPTVIEMANTFRDLEADYMRTNDMVGSCVIRPAPNPKCAAHQCGN